MSTPLPRFKADMATLRMALRKMHRRACGDESAIYMSIPADRERDADLLLEDALDELAAYRALTDAPDRTARLVAALRGLVSAVSAHLARGEDTTPGDFDRAWREACETLKEFEPESAREGGATEEEVARVRAVVTHRSVWLVIGVCGEYSDRSEWVVAAYFDRALAERHADLASEEEQRLLAAHLSAGGDEYEFRYRAQQYPNRYDAKVQRDYTGTDYHAAEVCDLRLSLPENASGASAPRPSARSVECSTCGYAPCMCDQQ